MRPIRSFKCCWGLLAFAVLVAPPASNAQSMFALPTYNPAVDRAISASNLTEVASKTTDPQVLLGLTFLAQTGNPARKELAARAVKANPKYAPIVAVIAVMMDGPNKTSVAELIQRDPKNALGYYLRGALLERAGHNGEALVAFRKAATCRNLRLYKSMTCAALFKALDALHLESRNRLSALSWMTARSANFDSHCLQGLIPTVRLLALDTEASNLLLVLAGHLYATDFETRTIFARRATISAFRLKADIAAFENSPMMNGYAAAVQALLSTERHLFRQGSTFDVAPNLPELVFFACSVADNWDQIFKDGFGADDLLPSDRPTYEKAKAQALKTAQTLIGMCLTDPDGILGAYLRGESPLPKDAQVPWVTREDGVDRLIRQRPELFKAASAFQIAYRSFLQVRRNEPRERK